MKLSISIFFTLLLALLVVEGVTFSSQGYQRVILEFFYFDPSDPQLQCPECGGSDVLGEFIRVSNLLDELQNEYGLDKLMVERLDIRDSQNSQLFYQYNLTKIPSVVANHEYPVEGTLITKQNLEYVVNEYLAGRTPTAFSENGQPFNFSNIAFAFSLGFFSGFSPCLMAMLAFILTYATGTSTGLKSGVFKALIFAVGLVTAVMLVGALFLLMKISVSSIFTFLTYFTWVASGIMILIGLNLVGALKLPVNTKPFFQKLAWKFGFSVGGLFFLGFLFYFVKVHCAIPFFMILLTRLPTQGTLFDVLPFLFFGVGVVTPFLAIGIVGGGAPKFAKQIRERYRDTIRAVSGLILIGYGIWLIALMLLWQV